MAWQEAAYKAARTLFHPPVQLDWDSQTPAAAAVLLQIARFTAAASNLPGKAEYDSWLTSQVLLPWAWANGEWQRQLCTMVVRWCINPDVLCGSARCQQELQGRAC